MQSLRENLWRLLNPGGGTIGLGVEKICTLPDTDFLVTELCSLTESMLAPRSEDRPSSARVLEKAGQLLDFLTPELVELRMEIPSPLSFGKKQKVYVQAVGKGLPYSGNWLNLGINEEPVTAEFRPVPDPEPLYDNVWEFDLPPFDKEGKQEIEVFAIVHHEKISCVQTVEVAASAEQLWQKGLYASALIKKPDKDWLNALDRRAEKEPAFEEEYLKILAQVRKEHPENKEINLRYWPLLHKIETSRHSDDISRHSVEKRNPDTHNSRHSVEKRNPEQSAGLDSDFRRNDGKKNDRKKNIGKWIAAALCLIVLCAGGWSAVQSHEKIIAYIKQIIASKTSETPPPDPVEEKRKAARQLWKTVQEHLQSGNMEKAENLLSEKKSELEILPEAAEKIPLLEEFLVFYDKAEKAGKAKTSKDQEKIVSDYKNALEICEKLSLSGLRDAVSGRLKKAESVRDNLLAAEKRERDRIAEQKRIEEEKRKKDEEERLKAEAEQQQKRTDAENQYAEIVNTVNAGKWPEAATLISDKRDLLKTWLDSEKYGHMKDLESFFGQAADAEKLRAKSSFDTPEDFAPVLSLYEKAKQTGVKLPAEIKLIARIQGKMKELTDRRDELLAKIQKEKEEEERRQKQNQAEGIYANIIRSVKNGDRETAENAISGNRNLLSTYLDKSKAGHIRNLENFWKYLDEGDGLAGKRPETEKNLKAAADAYSNAETVAKNLSGIVSLGDSVSGKRKNAETRRNELLAAEKKEQERIAEEKRKQEEQDGETVAGKTVKAKDGRFISYTDGTVYDTKMNLTWAAEDNGSNVTWQQAHTYCTKTYKGGGWRMPTQDELFSLVGAENGVTKGFACCESCDNYIITKLIRLTCWWVWASENDGSSGAYVHFYNGSRLWFHLDLPHFSRALPVRSGK